MTAQFCAGKLVYSGVHRPPEPNLATLNVAATSSSRKTEKKKKNYVTLHGTKPKRQSFEYLERTPINKKQFIERFTQTSLSEAVLQFDATVE